MRRSPKVRRKAKKAKPAKKAGRAKKAAAKPKVDRINKKAEVIAMMKRAKGAVVLQPIDSPAAKELLEPDVLAQTLKRSQCCAGIRKALRRVPANYRRILVDHFAPAR